MEERRQGKGPLLRKWGTSDEDLLVAVMNSEEQRTLLCVQKRNTLKLASRMKVGGFQLDRVGE